jgi:hypothetical protein
MDNSNLYNTGTGLSGLDNGYFQQITADQIIVESNLQLPNGLILPTDILPLQNNRDALNALTSGEVIIKGPSDDTYSSIPVSNDFSSSTNDIVRKTSGLIKTNTLNVGDTDPSTNYDIQVKHSSSNSELALINSILYKPTIKFIRNSSSDQFGGDTSDDFRIRNNNGFFDFDIGNIMSLTDDYVKINLNGDGELKDKVNLIMYRQTTAPAKNTAYVELEVDSSVNSGRLQKFPNLSGTFILDSTQDYIDLNTLKTNVNALTSGEIVVKGTSDNTFTSEAFGNNFLSSEIKKSSLGGVLQTQLLRTGDGGGVSFQNTGASTFSSISFGTNSAVNSAFNLPKNAGYILTEASVSDLEALRTSFNAQTDGNILTKSSTDTFSNEAFGNNFLSSEIKKSALGGVLQTQLLRTGDGGGVSFQNTGLSTFSSISHGANSAVNSAFNLPKNAGYLATEDIVYWEAKNTNDIINKNSDKVYIGAVSETDGAATGDLVLTKQGQSFVEIELRSDDASVSSGVDYEIGKIIAGFTSTDYRSGYVAIATHHANNTALTQTFKVQGATASVNGSLLIENSAAGNSVLTLRDSSDRDDIFIDFEGLNGGINTLVGRITTANDYLNMETKTTTNFNGLRFSTNNFLAMTIDNNQNIVMENQLGIAKSPASGFTLDVDGTLPSIFRGVVNFSGQALYDSGLGINNGSFKNTIDTLTLTANRAINFPDADGVVALTNNAGFVWTTSANDIYNTNSGNVFIGATSGSEKLEVTGNVKILSGNLQVDELQGTLGASTKIDLNPGGGNIDIVVPNSAGGISPNIDINFKTGSDIRMNLNSIDGLVFHEKFNFLNTTGGIFYSPLSFDGSVANRLNVGTNELSLQGGTTTSGINATIGVTKIGNGLSNYAMFSHSNNHSVGNYALLQQSDGVTFLNAASGKEILFRINNTTKGGIDDTPGSERTFFNSKTQTLPEYNSSGKLEANYCSMDNLAFRVFSSGGTQAERQIMYSQVVADESTTGFTLVALPLTDYGTQPGYVVNQPGFSFRVADPNREAQIDCSFSGYTTTANALQAIKLQMYSKQPNGTNAWVDIASFDFYVNDSFQHRSFSFSKLVTFPYSFYSFIRLILIQGSLTGSSGDFFCVSINQLPRQTR